MKKDTTLFWLVAALVLLGLAKWLLLNTAWASTLMIVVLIVCGVLAVFGGGKESAGVDKPANEQ